MSGATRKLLCFLEVLCCRGISHSGSTSQTSGQSSGTMEVESEEAEVTNAEAPTIPPNSDLNLDALDALCKNLAIEVTYPASWQKK